MVENVSIYSFFCTILQNDMTSLRTPSMRGDNKESHLYLHIEQKTLRKTEASDWFSHL